MHESVSVKWNQEETYLNESYAQLTLFYTHSFKSALFGRTFDRPN